MINFRIILIILFIFTLLPYLSREHFWHKSAHLRKDNKRTFIRSKRSPSESNRYQFEKVTSDLDEEFTNCFEEPKLWCNVDTKYRSIDGRCNNLKWRTWGMANTSLFRVVSARYSDELCSLPKIEEGLPSARKLADVIFHSERNIKLNNISNFFIIFGQIVADDVTSLDLRSSDDNFCCSNNTEYQFLRETPCSCMSTETLRENTTCEQKIRSKTTFHVQCPMHPVNQLTTVSSFLDASFLYTSNSDKLTQLRAMKNGKLKVTTNNLGRSFPIFLNGTRNETIREYVSEMHLQSSTIMMTTLFWRLHNFLADVLFWMNPTWEDEQLFQEARRILIALYQHIIYYEFLPILIGYEYAKKYDLMPTPKKLQESYNPGINPASLNSFSTAAFRVFHSIFPSTLNLIDEHRKIMKTINSTVFDNVDILEEDSFDQLIRGAIAQPIFPSQKIVPERINIYISDIERGRDHGLPTYNDFRELCKLPRILDFGNLMNLMNQEDVFQLAELYLDVDDIDLYIGGILENPMRDSIVGPTFQCLISEAFYRYKYGDRFFYEHKNTAAQFSTEQVQEIKKMTASLLICIASNRIQKVQSNVFYTTFNLNPETNCEFIFRPDYSLWQEKSPIPKKYFNWK